MALLTALTGFYLGHEGGLPIRSALSLLVGAGCIGGAANALNQFLERDIDARMHRTENRPLPSGRLQARRALLFGLLLGAAGLACLYRFSNPMAALMGGITLLVYLGFYTPLKRLTPLNTWVGAVSGAMPTLIGWCASGRTLGVEALSFFLILFFWQLPHFYAIAWVYREDYRRGGLRMLSTEERAESRVSRHLVLGGALLFLASLLPTSAGLTGTLFLSAAVFSGIFFLGFACFVASHRIAYARQLVSASILYLSVINLFFFLDKA